MVENFVEKKNQTTIPLKDEANGDQISLFSIFNMGAKKVVLLMKMGLSALVAVAKWSGT